ncbi:hypothetical protein LAZ67_22000631 [Cordylochernes scorpioides]|uniref:Uncharacterized protein n=1 Tax=Cordylochernes scorpioides TaxID=51811 RepID=A0ABY6LNA7_9ARAC|nr:hypothetical protein LAZ67_22000631 [Cordylochernes scorpioides]
MRCRAKTVPPREETTRAHYEVSNDTETATAVPESAQEGNQATNINNERRMANKHRVIRGIRPRSTSKSQAPVPRYYQNTFKSQAPVPRYYQNTFKSQAPFPRYYQNTSKSQAPVPRYYQNTSKSQAPVPRYYQNTSKSQAPVPRYYQNTSKSQAPVPRYYQNTFKSQAPVPRYYQNTSKSQAPVPRYYQNTSKPQAPVPSTFHIGITTEPVKVDRITEDSSMQRMTEAGDEYVADALINMQPHCDDLVGRLTDAIRGLAVSRAEEVIIAPIDISCATNILLHRLEQADKVHREILALPRQPASTMSHGNHCKKDHQASSQPTPQDPFKTSI